MLLPGQENELPVVNEVSEETRSDISPGRASACRSSSSVGSSST